MFLFWCKSGWQKIFYWKHKKGKSRSMCQIHAIAARLEELLKREKMYTNPELSIYDIASEIGTNRTYISTTINTCYNLNFCTYINHYRFMELAEKIGKGEDITYKELAQQCGFGSVDSMKRTVKLNTGLGFKEWKALVAKGEAIPLPIEIISTGGKCRK